MPRSVYRAPLYRRLLPWGFALVFVTVAPILIFWTAGYRINPKKITIERNGTLIVDSQPGGARIVLNGQLQRRVTPSTIQDVAPGPYTLRLERDGFSTWEKTLEIRSEQVTFADHVRLWRLGETQLLIEGNALAIESDPDQAVAAAVIASTTTADIRYVRNGTVSDRFAPSGLSTSTAPELVWNEAGNALLADYDSAEGRDAWISTDVLGPGQGSLQAADYTWNGSLLVSQEDGMRTVINTRRETLERDLLPDGVTAESDAFDLVVNTSTGAMVLRPRSILRRLYSLPSGDWVLAGDEGPYTLLRTDNRWLAIKPNGEPESGIATGQRPRWNTEGRAPRALLVNDNELWMWTPGTAPQLLLRQSERFVDAVWHRDGYHAFVATKDRVFAIELDDRSGHVMTDLVTGFESINGVAYAGDSLYIAGRRNGADGLYRRVIE
ncbi:PEGA domain-containing protein [Candidatus Uhrbacteria bacterium]|nr:PEGA domain-containing protein [Candidatus Uhrbacteria bacterium]